MNEPLLRRALSHYLDDAGLPAVTPFGEGLINETYLVEGPVPGGRAVLQRVSPVFGIAVHHDIEAITRHLERKLLATPLLLPARTGELAVEVEGGVFRLLTFVPGHSHSVMRPELCQEAGRLVGSFHAALADLEHRFHFTRPGAHDLAAHLRALTTAYDATMNQAGPPGFGQDAEEILRAAGALPAEVPGPLRVCHGDLKISNVRFGDDGRAACLLDLDTLAHLPLGIEMGDALRSWCNPLGEDHPGGAFDLDLFRLALSGYAAPAREFLTREERDGLVSGVLRIALELAARFAADVVNDRYFRWDPARFPSRAAHNLVRASGQLSLARSLAAQRSAAEATVALLF